MSESMTKSEVIRFEKDFALKIAMMGPEQNKISYSKNILWRKDKRFLSYWVKPVESIGEITFIPEFTRIK
jgi:hypothetical protein